MSTSIESRARLARRQAATLKLRMVQRGNIFELRNAEDVVLVGGIAAVENYLKDQYQPNRPGPAPARIPVEWRGPITAYCEHLAASGQSPRTIRHRRLSLARIARGLRRAPAEVTAEQLVSWLGRQTHWKPETRKTNRASARGFFSWAYRNGVVPVHLADDLPSVRVPAAFPRPVPDDAWLQAMGAADARVALMMRLAAEAGLRRAEVAQVHTRDVVDSFGRAQLIVHGKGGKTRSVPISDDLAAALRLGAGGHTPGLPGSGWLFPRWPEGGHLTPDYVGRLVQRVLPVGSMHKLRHRYATRAYRGSHNLRAVQELLGHSSIATTQKYISIDSDEIRAAAACAW
jgi:integrase/recombinase XerC